MHHQSNMLITQMLPNKDMEELIRLFNEEATYDKKAEASLQAMEKLVPILEAR